MNGGKQWARPPGTRWRTALVVTTSVACALVIAASLLLAHVQLFAEACPREAAHCTSPGTLLRRCLLTALLAAGVILALHRWWCSWQRRWTFHAPPGWPPAPPRFRPARSWRPDPGWPAAPAGWVWWRREPGAVAAQRRSRGSIWDP